MKTKYLSEVTNIKSGNSAPQGEEPFVNGKYNFYRTYDVGQIKQGEIFESRDKVNKETYLNLKIFPVNTILFPKSGASTFNNNRVIIKKEGAIASHLAGIKANPEFLNDYYLYYFLLTIDAKNLAQDSAYPSVNLKQISQIKIPVPSLQEQEKIVERLDKVFHDVDIAIETTEKNIKNIEDLYSSKSVNIFDSLAESFDNIYLNDACKVERGSSPRPIKQFITNDVTGVNWIKIGDIKEGEKYVTQTKERITIEGSKKSRYVKKGDLILTNSMSYGRPYIMDIDGYIHDGWFVLRLSENVETEYFYYLLSSPFVQKQFHSLAAGSVVKNISGNLLKKTKVIIPTLDQQLQTSEKLTEISKNTNRFMEINNLKINKLKILKSSILNKFFSVKSTSNNK